MTILQAALWVVIAVATHVCAYFLGKTAGLTEMNRIWTKRHVDTLSGSVDR